MKKFMFMVPLLALSGCGIFAGIGEKVADGVDEYCTRSTFQERMLIRDSVNNELAAKGHSVQITCAGDSTP